MSSLREQIANELDTFRTVANARSRGGDDPMDVAWEFVPRFMALIAEAMLSDEAVDAHLMRTWGWYDYDKGLWYDDAPEDVKEGARDDARHGVEGALAAAGITDAGQEGGEGE